MKNLTYNQQEEINKCESYYLNLRIGEIHLISMILVEV